MRNLAPFFFLIPVIPVVRQRRLGPHEQDAPVQAEGAAVVADAAVGGGQADVGEDAEI